MRLLVWMILMLGTLHLSWAGDSLQVDSPTQTVWKYDSSEVHVRSFDTSTLEELRNDPNYQYTQEPPVVSESIWGKAIAWLSRKIVEIFFDKESSHWAEILIYIIAGALIFYSVLKLLGVDIQGVFYRKSDHHTVRSELMEEDIHERNFKIEIEQAIQQQRYREAIRLHYLQSLQQLANHRLIEWKIDKTNQEYTIELQAPALRSPFSKITGIFENAYYGNFPITQEVFSNVSKDFQDFKVLIPQYATT